MFLPFAIKFESKISQIVFGDGTRTVASSNSRNKETNGLAVKGGDSPHNCGCATDIALFKNGEAVGYNSSELKSLLNLQINFLVEI